MRRIYAALLLIALSFAGLGALQACGKIGGIGVGGKVIFSGAGN